MEIIVIISNEFVKALKSVILTKKLYLIYHKLSL